MSEHMALTVACDVCGRPFWYSEDNDRRERPKPVKTAVDELAARKYSIIEDPALRKNQVKPE